MLWFLLATCLRSMKDLLHRSSWTVLQEQASLARVVGSWAVPDGTDDFSSRGQSSRMEQLIAGAKFPAKCVKNEIHNMLTTLRLTRHSIHSSQAQIHYEVGQFRETKTTITKTQGSICFVSTTCHSPSIAHHPEKPHASTTTTTTITYASLAGGFLV